MLDEYPVSIGTFVMGVPTSVNPSNIPSGAELAQVFESTADIKAITSKKVRNHHKKKRGRPKRDPNEGWPKRPLSAYNIFFKEYRNKLIGHGIKDGQRIDCHRTKKGYSRMKEPRKRRKKHGLITFAELAKSVGAKWKEMSDREKAQYKEIAKRNAEEYARALKAFLDERSKKAIGN